MDDSHAKGVTKPVGNLQSLCTCASAAVLRLHVYIGGRHCVHCGDIGVGFAVVGGSMSNADDALSVDAPTNNDNTERCSADLRDGKASAQEKR